MAKRAPAAPVSDLWIEYLIGNPRAIASFVQYMSETKAKWRDTIVLSLQRGDTRKAEQMAAALDMVDMIVVRVVNENKERYATAAYRGKTE